jgi:hypothetical protein
MRWMVLVVGALVSLASGCQECAGCIDAIVVALPPNTLSQGKPYTFNLCVDGACTKGIISPVKQGANCTGDPWLCAADVGATSTITILFTDRSTLAGSATRQITIQVTAGAQVVAQKSGTVSLGTQQTAGCDVICRRGTLN